MAALSEPHESPDSLEATEAAPGFRGSVVGGRVPGRLPSELVLTIVTLSFPSELVELVTPPRDDCPMRRRLPNCASRKPKRKSCRS